MPENLIEAQFPDQALARALLPYAFDDTDIAHDMAHLLRVWRNVERIAAVEGGDMSVLQAATLLHDCVWVDKASSLRSQASRLAAGKARDVLAGLAWPEDKIDAVAHAIEAHSYSAGVAPKTLEARVLQDADRLDALGFVGIARCMAYSGEHGRALYDLGDPAGKTRALDDGAYALDHFQTKLFKLGDMFCTPTGRALAEGRMDRLRAFYDGLLDEIGSC